MPQNIQTPLSGQSPSKNNNHLGGQMGDSYGASYLRSSNPSFSGPIDTLQKN